MRRGQPAPARDEREANRRLFLLLCAVLGFMSVTVLFAGGNFGSNLIALAIMWALLFAARYMVRALPVAYHYFRELHTIHRQVDQTQQANDYWGVKLTPEEQAKLDALDRRLGRPEER